MKITEITNHAGQPIVKFELVEETKDAYYLGNSEISSLQLAKSSFENMQQHFGASRDGSTFYIPMPKTPKV